MRKISAMYQWSGGTDYRHVCHECDNCIKIQQGKREVCKCRSYGVTDNCDTNWKDSYIACKAFGKEPPEVPIFFAGVYSKEPSMHVGEKPAKSSAFEYGEYQIEEQLSLFDLFGL